MRVSDDLLTGVCDMFCSALQHPHTHISRPILGNRVRRHRGRGIHGNVFESIHSGHLGLLGLDDLLEVRIFFEVEFFSEISVFELGAQRIEYTSSGMSFSAGSVRR